MVTIRVEDELPRVAVDFLKHCYRFVNLKWPHEIREDLPDHGFERSFRTSCITDISGWEVSKEREMRLGFELTTASGVLHEIDIVAKHSDVSSILELKNRQGSPAKNDVIVFFAKILDYLTLNPEILLKEMCPIFVSTAAFEVNALAACLGLGIHPIGPMLRPVHMLVDNARAMDFEIRKGIPIPKEINERFQDYCADLNSIGVSLSDNWISSRFGYLSDDAIVIKATGDPDTEKLAHSLRQINADCDWLLASIREAIQ